MINHCNIRVRIQNNNKIEITFKTTTENGLLFYTGNETLNSYLLIGFINGKLIYSFSLPKKKQVFTLKSNSMLNDNKWHTIIIERFII